MIDQAKAIVGSGVAVFITVTEDGKASVAAGVTDDQTDHYNAVDLVQIAVAMLGGKGGGGRRDFAQGGGPDGSKAEEARNAVRQALEKVAA
jgi:alanyl-tRNA synthetase